MSIDLIYIIQDFANMMEGIEEGEPNSLQVEVGGNMSKPEVVKEILRQPLGETKWKKLEEVH